MTHLVTSIPLCVQNLFHFRNPLLISRVDIVVSVRADIDSDSKTRGGLRVEFWSVCPSPAIHPLRTNFPNPRRGLRRFCLA